MRTILWGALTLLILAPVDVAVATDPPPRPEGNRLIPDLEQLVQWLEGRFDNDLQVREKEGDEDHRRLHSLFVPQDLAELGDHVFYVQQSLDDNPRKVHRQRFYLFEVDPEADAIRLKVYVPSDPSALFDLHKEPTKRTGMQVEDLGHEPGCDLLLNRKKRGKKGDHFEGSVAEGMCREESSRYGKTLVITQELYLDDDQFWILEQARDLEGNLVYGPASGMPQKLRRAHTYRCESFSRDGDSDWQRIRDFDLHDQGSRLRIDAERSGQLTAHLMRMPGKGKRGKEALHLVLEEKGKDKPLAKTVAQPGVETLQVESAHLRVSCELQADWIRQGVGDPES